MFLLRLRHWQAFLLIFVLPFILRYALTQLLVLFELSASIVLRTVVDALPTIVPVLWLWLTGLHFFKRLPGSIKISSLYFNLGALYFVFYILLLIYTLNIVRESITEGVLPLGMLALLLPMHLFSTFCYLYMVYFVARCISVEKLRIITVHEYISVLAQIIFLPIGVWFLQSRLNKLSPKGTNY